MNFPILSAITFIPLVGALFVFLTRGEKDEKNSGAIYISIFTSIVNFFIILFVWYSIDKTTSDFQFIEEYNWINGFIKFKFGIDGISILFILLTAFIIPICIFSCFAHCVLIWQKHIGKEKKALTSQISIKMKGNNII